MGKRKDFDNDRGTHLNSETESSSSDEDINMLEVDFEWFDPQPDFDFHGLKTLLRQLLDVDAQLFDLSALTELILAQPLLGSTVKVEGNETDPYAFLTVLNLREHRATPVIQDLTNYIVRQAKKTSAISILNDLLAPASQAHIGLILTERLINIPSEVSPPMYKMLLEEISWAIEANEPYTFTHYLILSKTYHEIASALDQEDDGPRRKKKMKQSGARHDGETFYFHPEDEVLQRHAQCFGSFEYDKQEGEGQSDARRAFQELGIKPQGYMILVEAPNFEAMTAALSDYIGGLG